MFHSSRATLLFFPLLVFLFTGCQHLQLQRNTLRQASTLTDLEYDQVLTNLAMIRNTRDAMPYFSAQVLALRTSAAPPGRLPGSVGT